MPQSHACTRSSGQMNFRPHCLLAQARADPNTHGPHEAFTICALTLLIHLKFYRGTRVGGGLRSVRAGGLATCVRFVTSTPALALLHAVNAYRSFEDVAATFSPAVAGAFARLNFFFVAHLGVVSPAEVIWPVYTPLLLFWLCLLLTLPAAQEVHLVTFSVTTARGSDARANLV